MKSSKMLFGSASPTFLSALCIFGMTQAQISTRRSVHMSMSILQSPLCWKVSLINPISLPSFNYPDERVLRIFIQACALFICTCPTVSSFTGSFGDFF